MKKILAAAAAVMLCLSAGCGKKTSKASEIQQDTTSAEESTTEPITLQPDPLAPKVTTTAAETSSAAVTTTAAKSGEAAADPMASGIFQYNSDGAIVFNEDQSVQSDDVLIAAAQALFESACTTEWNYTVGCPYDLDQNDFIENEFGWEFYRIKNAGINSMEELRADFNRVFSGRYPDNLSELYIEKNGHVYATDAARGRDIYYTDSVITGITSRTDDEIVFTVENNFSGSDWEPTEPVTKTEEFSVVIESDGTWKVGEFRLPY